MVGPASDTKSNRTSRAISYRGPEFSLKNFETKDFIVKDFIETLSDVAVPAARRSGNSQVAFDPKPLIRSFEHALARLGALSEDLEEKENELSGSVRRAEAQHSQKSESLGRKLEGAIQQFNKLDNSLNGSPGDSMDGETGGNVAVRIGERLEELDRQRQRAQDAKFLIQCWMEVSERGDLSSLEDVRRLGGGDGKVRCAHIARQLLRLSHRLDPDLINGFRANGVDPANGQNGAPAKKHNTREIIEKFLEMLEKDLLKQFDDFYRRQNFDGMRVRTLHPRSSRPLLNGLIGMRCGSARLQRRRKRNGTFRQPTSVLHRPKSTGHRRSGWRRGNVPLQHSHIATIHMG